MSQFTVNFSADEFQRVSYRKLTARELEEYRAMAVDILQPVRREFGPVVVTSALRPPGVRSASGNVSAHEKVGTVDFVVPGIGDHFPVCEWIAKYKSNLFGEMLLEEPKAGETTQHVHITRPGVGGRGEFLREVKGSRKATGRPQFVAAATAVAPLSPVVEGTLLGRLAPYAPFLLLLG